MEVTMTLEELRKIREDEAYPEWWPDSWCNERAAQLAPLFDLAEAMLMLEEMKGISLETYDDGHIFIDADALGLRKCNFNYNVPELPNTKQATLPGAIRAAYEEWKGGAGGR